MFAFFWCTVSGFKGRKIVIAKNFFVTTHPPFIRVHHFQFWTKHHFSAWSRTWTFSFARKFRREHAFWFIVFSLSYFCFCELPRITQTQVFYPPFSCQVWGAMLVSQGAVHCQYQDRVLPIQKITKYRWLLGYDEHWTRCTCLDKQTREAMFSCVSFSFSGLEFFFWKRLCDPFSSSQTLGDKTARQDNTIRANFCHQGETNWRISCLSFSPWYVCDNLT